jgi:hypothetical protein
MEEKMDYSDFLNAVSSLTFIDDQERLMPR